MLAGSEKKHRLPLQVYKGHVSVVIYLFMPDHLHIVLRGASDESDAYRGMRSFKQKTGYLFSKAGLGIVWQKDFYDHILRTEDDLSNHLRYILNNPVRKGLARTWKEYPLKGSSVIDLDQWNAD
jgi:putative transposase